MNLYDVGCCVSLTAVVHSDCLMPTFAVRKLRKINLLPEVKKKIALSLRNIGLLREMSRKAVLTQT